MKMFILLIASLSVSSAFAGDTDAVISCAKEIRSYIGNYPTLVNQGGILCSNVKSDSDTKAVEACVSDAVNQLIRGGRYSRPDVVNNIPKLCSNVKSEDDAAAVINCVKTAADTLSAGIDIAVLCSNVKN